MSTSNQDRSRISRTSASARPSTSRRCRCDSCESQARSPSTGKSSTPPTRRYGSFDVIPRSVSHRRLSRLLPQRGARRASRPGRAAEPCARRWRSEPPPGALPGKGHGTLRRLREVSVKASQRFEVEDAAGRRLDRKLELLEVRLHRAGLFAILHAAPSSPSACPVSRAKIRPLSAQSEQVLMAQSRASTRCQQTQSRQ